MDSTFNLTEFTALYFAMGAHRGVGQKRKYNGEPYEVHVIDVYHILIKYVPDCTPSMMAAAFLHDTVEDTNVTVDDLNSIFGPVVSKLVEELTDTTTHSDGNRVTRRAMDRERISKVSAEAQTIKCADIIANVRDIRIQDPDFAKVYIPEKREMLKVLTKADPRILRAATEEVEK